MTTRGKKNRRLSGKSRLAVLAMAICSLPLWPTVGQDSAATAAEGERSDQAVATARSAEGHENESVERKTEDGETASVATLPEPTKFAKTPQSLSRDEASPVLSIACSPDGTTLASAHQDKTVRLRDTRTGEVRRILGGEDAEVSCVAFSPDGKTLAIGSCDNTVKLWQVAGDDEPTCLAGHTDWVLAVAFAPDGKTVASGGSDKTVRLWDIETAKEKAVLEGHDALVRCLAFSPDGKLLASGSPDKTVRLWDVSLKTETTALEGRRGGALAFSPDGKTLASVGEDGAIILRDMKTGNERRIASRHRGAIWCLVFSPQGGTLASGNSDATIALWDPESASERDSLRGHTEYVTTLAFTPDTSDLISGSTDGTIKLWKSRQPPVPPIVTLPATDDRVCCRFAFFSPDGRVMVTAGDDKVIKVWDVQTGRLLRKDKYRGGTPICGELSPDGELLATGTFGDTVHLWDVAAGRRVGELTTGQNKLLGVDFSPDGERLAVASGGKTVSVWHVQSHQKLWVSAEQLLPVTSVTFSPDGKTLATATGSWKEREEPGEAKLWDAESGKELATVPGLPGDSAGVFSSPYVIFLAPGGGDATLRIWDAESRQLNLTISTAGAIQRMTFLPDGESVLAAHYGGSVSHWDADSAELVADYEAPTERITVLELSYSPDGSLLATSSTEGAVRLWPTMPAAASGPGTSAALVREWTSDARGAKE